MRIALLSGTSVTNVIEADAAFEATLAAATFAEDPAGVARIGGTFVNGAFVAPPEPAPEPPQPITVINRLAFAQRFTQAERVAIRTASNTDPKLADALDLLRLADTIDLSAPMTTAYVTYLVKQNLLIVARAKAIMSTDASSAPSGT